MDALNQKKAQLYRLPPLEFTSFFQIQEGSFCIKDSFFQKTGQQLSVLLKTLELRRQKKQELAELLQKELDNSNDEDETAPNIKSISRHFPKWIFDLFYF